MSECNAVEVKDPGLEVEGLRELIHMYPDLAAEHLGTNDNWLGALTDRLVDTVEGKGLACVAAVHRFAQAWPAETASAEKRNGGGE